MGDLHGAVNFAMIAAKGNEAISGSNRINAQLCNVVARGGYNVLTDNYEDNAKWIIQSDSRVIVCTKIEKEYVKGVLYKFLTTYVNCVKIMLN